MFLKIIDGVKTYGNGAIVVKALDHVNFELEKGKICVILGPSGSGKSTLMNMLGGIDSLDSGSLIFEDKDISKYNRKELNRYRKDNIGFVFQFYNLIDDLSAEENIKVVSDICLDALDLHELLESLGISDLKYRFPKELSGGQQQRVAIARAMIKNPKLLLCDELTGALDSTSSKIVLECIAKLNRDYGTTVVIITHNNAIASMADKVIYIKDGKIIDTQINQNKLCVKDLEL